MITKWTRLLNILALFLFLLISAGLQTTLWFQFFGQFPAPTLWLILVVYVILYRPPRVALVMSYAMGFAILGFSALSLGLMMLTIFFLYILVSNFKSHFYWGGVGYFTLMCLIAGFAFHIFYLAGSYIIEAHGAEILFWHRFGEAILTPLFAIPYFHVLKQIDRWTIVEDSFAETRGLDL